jgi:hypothetical protein
MAKMWAGRTDGTTEQLADDFNSSIRVDCRMYREDITGSMAHAAMLGRAGIITEEEATLKSGVVTWNGTTLAKLCSTARVEESNGIRTVKIGGIGNHNGKSYALCFHHIDKVDGDVWVLIRGVNKAGFTLAFAKDKETVIDAEFACLPLDSDGTLIQYVEEIGETV